MNADTFFQHHGLDANPFAAEEARLDPIFDRLPGGATDHPDFAKIMGRIDQPATAVVFGEKGSGKTAIRLMLGRKINEHNQKPENRPVLVVAYDDMNPVLDKLLASRRQKADDVLDDFRLEDHQDAILARAVTKLVSAILGDKDHTPEPVTPLGLDGKTVRSLPMQTRVDLVVLAALYDEPASGTALPRFNKLRRKLHLGIRLPLSLVLIAGFVCSAIAASLIVMNWLMSDGPGWLLPALSLACAASVGLWGFYVYRYFAIWSRARKAVREMPAVKRSADELRQMFEALRPSHLAGQPIPSPSRGSEPLSDTRYQLTRRFISAIGDLGFVGMIVFVDRLDEPTLVHGDAKKMKALAWPMFDNKFLKQESVGLKLLLPLELRYELGRETAAFFQEARLDKQNLIDRLTWSGATLYDICNRRLAACYQSAGSAEGEPPTLGSLFAEDVSREMLIDALDQMHQPRDAFKFLYAAIQEHCRMVADDEQTYRIARITLETVRRDQANRVQELYRGRGPG